MQLPNEIEQAHELTLLVRARHPLIQIESPEDERVMQILQLVAGESGMPVFRWSSTRGLTRVGVRDAQPLAGTQQPDAALAFIERSDMEALFFMPDFITADAVLAPARLKAIYQAYFRHHGALVFSGASVDVPEALRPLFTIFRLKEPSAAAYHAFVTNVVREIARKQPVRVTMDGADVRRLLNALHGLTYFDVRRIISEAVVEDGELGPDDLEKVIKAKRDIIERSGVLEYFPHDESLKAVAGLNSLKSWLRKRAAAFTEPERLAAFGLKPPKGVMLLGVQGCGKSLCAKAIASEWSLPLVRFDPSNLMDKFVGESEKNLRKAMRLAESLAPVVLWVDEIEKGFQTNATDGGPGSRMLGTFLAWLQDKDDAVFVIATSNDLSKLPPELLRKGRFDEIFFVDLPKPEARKNIFTLHLNKRHQIAEDFDLEALTECSDGFSGAEIEQAVVSALYAAFNDRQPLDSEMLLEELRTTRPLSTTMAEKIDSLRAWASERAVGAD